jgi:hypothetical protein
MRFVDAKSAKIGQGRRIHQIGFFFERLVEDALDGGVANEFGLPLRNMAAVSQGNFFDRAL